MRPGYEGRVPKTADEFAEYWRQSELGKKNAEEVAAALQRDGKSEDKLIAFRESAKAEKAKHLSKDSKYLISYPYVPRTLCLFNGTTSDRSAADRMQVRLACIRRFQVRLSSPLLLLCRTMLTRSLADANGRSTNAHYHHRRRHFPGLDYRIVSCDRQQTFVPRHRD